MTALFTNGIVAAPPTVPFAFAVLAGVGAWVGFATLTRLPVSTTHALMGALIGAGVQLAPGAVAWGVVAGGVALPLLTSVVVSYLFTTALSLPPLRVPGCVSVDAAGGRAATGVGVATSTSARSTTLGVVGAASWTAAAHCADRTMAGRVRLAPRAAHWLTSGATSFARGLNDTPKIVAIGAFALMPAGGDPALLALGVAVAMAAGALVAGARVARVLGEQVVRMDHAEGLRANLASALLVGVGANLGLPMSTTQVAAGAIAGVARGDVGRLNRRTLRDLALAWTATPVIAGVVAAVIFAFQR